MDYPDKGVMGLAKRNPGGQMRLGLSATAGSAVLYSAIVLFGVGSASPSATDVSGPDRRASVALIPGRTDIVSGSVQKLPQASPEPGRQRSRVRPHRPGRSGVESTASPTSSTVESAPPAPAPPRGTESASPSVRVPSAAPVAVPLPSLEVPTVSAPEPAVPLPLPLPALPVPPLPLPQPLPLPLDLPG